MKRIFLELKRRNVLRTVAAYGVLAWLIIQIAAVVFPVLGVPDWVTTLIVVLMIIGFPVSIVVSWVYDWTPEGVVATDAIEADHDAVSTAFGRQIDFVIITLLAVAIGWLVYERLPPAAPEKSIAVLPFANLSPDPESEYFVDGFSEDLLNALARLPDLRVIGQSSSFTFRQDRDISKIGKKLNVATVLDGSVRKSDGRLRITARLLDTSNGYQIWSQSFDRGLRDIFAIQDEISHAIVDAMKIHLVGDVEARLPVTEAANVEAYNFYLLGRHHFKRRSVAELEHARELFNRAIASDPNYAPAYAALVDTLSLLSEGAFGSIPMKVVSAEAMPLLDKAFRINPDLADIHASLGFLRRMERDFLAAEASLKRAIELSPNMARAHNWLYSTYDGASRHRESIEALKRAFELDPLSPIISANLSAEYWSRGEDHEALTAANRVIEILPESPVGYLRAGRVYWTRGDLAEALMWYQEADALSPGDPITRREMGYLLLNLGEHERAEDLLSDRVHLIKLAEGSIEVAIQAAYDVLARRPNEPAVIVAAARSQAWAGNFKASRDLLEPLDKESTRPQGPLFERANLVFWDPAIPAMDLALARLRTEDARGASRLTDQIGIYFDHLRAEGLDHPGIIYQEARLHSLKGKTSEALASLRQAIKTGWRFWYTEKDPILKPLQDEPEFKPLMEEMHRLVALEREKVRMAVTGGDT